MLTCIEEQYKADQCNKSWEEIDEEDIYHFYIICIKYAFGSIGD
jgi:hypothetical protein